MLDQSEADGRDDSASRRRAGPPAGGKRQTLMVGGLPGIYATW